MNARAALLQHRVDAAVAEERRRALRALLQRPLFHRDADRELFVLARRHEDYLRVWFQAHPGWVLHGHVSCLRLLKVPSPLLPVDRSHPARDPRHGQPFTRRRYVLLCLALATCERSGRQITLGRLAEDIQGQLAGDPVLVAAGIGLDLERRPDRGDLVAVGRMLLDWRLLERVQGDEDRFVATGEDCLYTIHREVLARLMAVRQGPSLIEDEDMDGRLRALQHEPAGGGDEERRRRLRQGLKRALLERPVVYYRQLPSDAADYLRSQQSHLVHELCEATGLIAEQRQEGVALVDDQFELADFRLPQEGTDGHAALLLAEFCAGALRDGAMAVPLAACEAHLADAAERFGAQWRRDATTAEGARQLCRHLLDRLQALGLVVCNGDGVRPQAAIARYALDAEASDDETEDAGEQLDLFGGEHT
ncbi:MAG: TIGR02678 family protein [Planctomycetota bacterium]